MAMPASFKQGASPDVRDLLLRAGVGQFVAEMSVRYMFFLPLTTDTRAQGVRQIVEGLQRLLNEHGARLVVDGGLGRETIDALQIFSGPRWAERSWSQLYTDVLSGRRWPGFVRRDRSMPLEPVPDGLGTTLVGDLVMSPLGLVAAAAAAIFLWRRK